MPIPPDLFNPSMPQPFRGFLNRLWTKQAKGLIGTLANIRLEPKGNQKSMTLLERRRELVEMLAESDALSAVAKKAYKSDAGRRAIEHLAECAVTSMERIDEIPSDLEPIQRGHLIEILDMLRALRGLIEADRPTLTAFVSTKEWGRGTYDVDEGGTLPDGFVYRNALADIVGRSVKLNRLFTIETGLAASHKVVGRCSAHSLAIILESVEGPLEERIAELSVHSGVDVRGDVRTRRLVHDLWDATEKFARDFNGGRTGPLKRSALVTAFVVGLLNPFPGQSVSLTRVNEIIKRRQKFAQSPKVPFGSRSKK
jgi:hypothetical protein